MTTQITASRARQTDTNLYQIALLILEQKVQIPTYGSTPAPGILSGFVDGQPQNSEQKPITKNF